MPHPARRLAVEHLEARLAPATFTVTRTADDAAAGSFRWAMGQANTATGADQIAFNIPGPGPHTIVVGSALPSIRDDVTVDGYTQPGSSPNTLAVGNDAQIRIEIDGSGTGSAFASAPGSNLTATTIRGLSLVNFAGPAINWNLSSTVSNTVVEGNFIGIRPDGTTPRANGSGVYFDNPTGNGNHRVGGPTPGQRNVISGNRQDGVFLNSKLTVIEGNYIGTDASGTVDLGNGENGVELRQNQNRIGGTVIGSRNIISGNERDGVYFAPGTEANNTVAGNYIGLSADGTQAIGNRRYGVYVVNTTGSNLFGGTTTGARNVISGNGQEGVLIELAALYQEIVGNYVGTNAAGTAAVPNNGIGIRTLRAARVVDNVSSGNILDGMFLGTDVTAQGNIVGATADGTAALPNGRHGVQVIGSNTLVGGTTPGEANAVVFNTQAGVRVTSPSAGVRVLGNVIHSNGGLGIDLGNGANADQPAPTLTGVTTTAQGLRVSGTLTSAVGVHRIEVFANVAADPSGAGEGQAFLGFTTVTVDASGTAAFTADVSAPPTPFGATGFVTATATNDGTDNTSEFSGALPFGTSPPPSPPTSPPTSPPPTSPPASPPPISPPVVAIPREFGVGAGAGAGTATLYNPDQSVRYTVTPFGAGFTGGVRTATADFNRDGVADLLVGTGPGRATQLFVYDGKTQAELFTLAPFEETFTGGVYVAAADLTGDGTPDLVVTPDEGGGPRARVFSGAGFGQVADFFGINDPDFRGGARATLGDLDADGAADLIVAAGFGGGPRVAVFNGRKVTAEGNLPSAQTLDHWETWKLLADFLAFEPDLRNGTFVAAGDTTGDGKAELVIGGGPGGGPRVTVFGGAELLTGRQVRVADYFAGDVTNRGGVRVAVKDLDGGDRADVLTGAGAGGGSAVTAYSGAGLGGSTPPTHFAFDAISGFTGGVFVG